MGDSVHVASGGTQYYMSAVQRKCRAHYGVDFEKPSPEFRLDGELPTIRQYVQIEGFCAPEYVTFGYE